MQMTGYASNLWTKEEGIYENIVFTVTYLDND